MAKKLLRHIDVNSNLDQFHNFLNVLSRNNTSIYRNRQLLEFRELSMKKPLDPKELWADYFSWSNSQGQGRLVFVRIPIIFTDPVSKFVFIDRNNLKARAGMEAIEVGEHRLAVSLYDHYVPVEEDLINARLHLPLLESLLTPEADPIGDSFNEFVAWFTSKFEEPKVDIKRVVKLGRKELTEEEWQDRRERVQEVERTKTENNITYEQACARVGLPYSTFRNWKHRTKGS